MLLEQFWVLAWGLVFLSSISGALVASSGVFAKPETSINPLRRSNKGLCSRDAKDKERLEYVREMNRKRFAETGEYMTEVRVEATLEPAVPSDL